MVLGDAKWSDVCMVLNLERYKWYVGGFYDVVGVGRLGRGDISWALCDFPLILLSCTQKVINRNFV